MTFQGDPHRALGIPPTASLNEIKSAYRRLVKQYHPDAAGERALPRSMLPCVSFLRQPVKSAAGNLAMRVFCPPRGGSEGERK